LKDWANVHDSVLFHAPVAPGQLAPWQHVKGSITNDDALVLAQCEAKTPLAELLLPFHHWILCECQNFCYTAAEGHFTHRGMQIGQRKIQSSNDGVGTVPPVVSERDTWMQAYTRRLLLSRYDNHMLCLNAQRNLQR